MSAFPKGCMIRLHYVHATLSLCDLLSPREDWCPHEGQGHHQEAADVQKGRQGGEVSSELLRLQQLSLTVADEVRPVSTLSLPASFSSLRLMEDTVCNLTPDIRLC